jgi:hypothetical protein
MGLGFFAIFLFGAHYVVPMYQDKRGKMPFCWRKVFRKDLQHVTVTRGNRSKRQKTRQDIGDFLA